MLQWEKVAFEITKSLVVLVQKRVVYRKHIGVPCLLIRLEDVELALKNYQCFEAWTHNSEPLQSGDEK